MNILLKIYLTFFTFFLCHCHSQKNCFRPEKNKIKFLCPIDYIEVGGFQLIVTPMKEVLLECDNLHSLNVTQFPDLTLAKINLLQFRFCPLPEDGFIEILDSFSTKDVVVIEFEYGNLRNKNLSKKYFRGLEHVKFLKMNKNKFKEIDEDVFSYTPNLYALELKQNYLLKLTSGIFETIPNLEWLSLAENQLNNLPPKLFRSLQNLEFLKLSNNRLTQLNDSTFDGLTSLRSLELSANRISKIEKNTFHKLKNLVNISLAMNDLRSLPPDVFRNNEKLESISLNDNENFTLSDYLFANMSLLKEIDLSTCNLEEIPERIFQNSIELKTIRLQNNRIKKLSQNIFKNLVYLEELDLSVNQIKNIGKIFANLQKLKRLFLQKNQIKTISENAFVDMIRLEELNLEENKIGQIRAQAFFNNDRLKVINLSKNQYSGNDMILKDLVYLEDVNLSHNLITEIEQVINLDNKPLLERVDLSHNLIANISLFSLQAASETEIFLDNNKISLVTFDKLGLLTSSYTSILHLGNNPIRCDCQNYDLVKYFHGDISQEIHQMYNIRNGITCDAPEELEDVFLEDVPLSALTCQIDDSTECPEKCTCHWRPFDQTVTINCAYQNLTKFPKILANYSIIEMNLTHNSLVNTEMVGYDNVTRLYLSYNNLESLTVIPLQLDVVELDHNKLKKINFEVLQALNNSFLSKITLKNNPWACECGSENLTKFIRQYSKYLDFEHIYCSESTTRLIDLNYKDLCQDLTLVYVISTISVLLVLAIFSTLYYRHHQEIKIWLFSKNLCLFWVSEEDLDIDKIYDAFISYSHLDEEFVLSLVSELETGTKPYKFCLHYRDWIPGELINAQIVKSVADSRRTVIILSKNFLKSVWGKAEFQQAHAEAMSEGRARVIVILYGEIDLDKVDKDLKLYLNTNTYLKWDDPYFWDKLRYSLPHRRTVKV